MELLVNFQGHILYGGIYPWWNVWGNHTPHTYMKPIVLLGKYMYLLMVKITSTTQI